MTKNINTLLSLVIYRMVISELEEVEKEVLMKKYSRLGLSESKAKGRLEEVITQLRVPIL